MKIQRDAIARRETTKQSAEGLLRCARNDKQKPLIGITMGDPKGIGPEIVKKAICAPSILRICRPIVFGDEAYYSYAKAKKLSNKQAGALAYQFTERAIQAANEGLLSAVVTAPVSKNHFDLAGHKYPGQTELFAKKMNTKKYAMMLVSPSLKVAFATSHIPISKVASSLTSKRVLEVIELSHETLKTKFKIQNPKIALAGLNPHAGESGLFGSEEIKIIRPALKKAQQKGIQASGPYPADTLFHKAVKGEFDLVIAMYHDQGMVPLKLLHFDEGVNITLGLPVLRTSPDHGTAFDIAGKGIANPKSMIAAIKIAVEMI